MVPEAVKVAAPPDLEPPHISNRPLSLYFPFCSLAQNSALLTPLAATLTNSLFRKSFPRILLQIAGVAPPFHSVSATDSDVVTSSQTNFQAMARRRPS